MHKMNEVRQIAIIMNPTSSRGKAKTRQKQLCDLMDSAIAVASANGQTVTYRILETTAPGSSIRTGQSTKGSGAFLALQAIAEGATTIVAAGGDGTVGEVANALVGTNVHFGVLPMGTGNDFARTLGIGLDLELAVRTVVFGKALDVDLGKGPGGYFINVAGCGFDAEVAYQINHKFRRLRGTTAYVVAVVSTLMKLKPYPIKLTIDGVEQHETVMLCAVANAKTYGGGMRIAPNADISDGQFDIVLVGKVSKLEFLRTFPKVFKGTHLDHPQVKVVRGKNVRIESDRTMPVLADGEEIGFAPVEFSLLEGGLRVLVPAES
jgi:diacylglycerol kinase (ATP)